MCISRRSRYGYRVAVTAALIGFAIGMVSSPCQAFVTEHATSTSSRGESSTLLTEKVPRGVRDDGSEEALGRRDLLKSVAGAAVVVGSGALSPFLRPANADIEGVATPTISDAPVTKSTTASSDAGGGVTLYKTNSGLKYIEIAEGEPGANSPQYGQLVSIAYKAYVKLPDIKGQSQKLQEFDSSSAYLIKHGNGRTVPGLDEGIHTMKVGGKRRLILPAKLGYVTGGLGPLPVSPFGRNKLNNLLDQMVEVKGGNVVFDVTLRNIISDEADQGYYSDGSLDPDDFQRLRDNIQRTGQEARARAASEGIV
eukprot:CAMPEP_0197717012 /NCGR_PEP_ID=MMETSP1434-20131217/1709_1 /TAXON_ID=265543 /ORGANISM="Minutocellus polymorphus, Strain CCMP3303" /LENGTH=309 /DNA_ID=CAMNT_0043301481 /DNA_START=79 /DNA_END=1008 /DNA_ORIENTATION=+